MCTNATLRAFGVSQFYQWYTNIVQCFTNGTIANTICTNGTIGRTPNRAIVRLIWCSSFRQLMIVLSHSFIPLNLFFADTFGMWVVIVIESYEFKSRVMRKPTFCKCENKDADQLPGNREADQRLCFRYMDSAIRLLSKSEISSL